MEDYNECNLAKKFKQLPEETQKDGELIKAMRKEFEQRKGDYEYKAILPDGPPPVPGN